MKVSELAIQLYLQSEGIDFFTQYQFDAKENGGSGRKWRSDFYIWGAYGQRVKILLEYEGAMSYKSRHLTIGGYTKDCEKYRNASIQGFTLLRYTAKSFDKVGFDIIKQDIMKVVNNE